MTFLLLLLLLSLRRLDLQPSNQVKNFYIKGINTGFDSDIPFDDKFYSINVRCRGFTFQNVSIHVSLIVDKPFSWSGSGQQLFGNVKSPGQQEGEDGEVSNTSGSYIYTTSMDMSFEL